MSVSAEGERERGSGRGREREEMQREKRAETQGRVGPASAQVLIDGTRQKRERGEREE